ncbi:MAG: 50S ribosomal protein L25 [Planctomycetota bacterium]
MEFRELKGQPREQFGTAHARRLRKNYKIPATILVKKGNPIHIYIDSSEIKKNLSPHHHFYLLKVNNRDYKVFLKNIQKDHLGNAIYQIDFESVEPGKLFELKIPITYTGQPQGVIEGGHIEYLIHEIKVKTSIDNIIEELKVDISNLRIKQSLKISDIKLPSGVTIVSPPASSVMVIIRQPVQEVEKPKEEVATQAVTQTSTTPEGKDISSEPR